MEEFSSRRSRTMASIISKSWGSVGGKPVQLFTLRTNSGYETSITNYGGRVVTLLCPANDGSVADIVLGYDSLQHYLDDPWYFGAIVGRYCNRIANASFTLNDKVYSITRNDGPNS